MKRADTAFEWLINEVGAMTSQSGGNINVPETSLTRLVRERNELLDRLAKAEKKGRVAGLRDAARIVSTRKAEMKTDAYNCAVEECRVFILAEVEREETL